MTVTPRPHPPVLPHGDLFEVLPGIHIVMGSIRMGPMQFSRNMVAIQQGDGLVLVNTVRLDESGLAALDALGRVTDTIRLAGFHGSDDPFYKERYGCTVHAIRGQSYFAGFDPKKGRVYFEADNLLEPGDRLPIEGASMHVIGTRPPEGLLWIPAEGGTLITGDSLQHWATADEHFNLAGRLSMWLMGFLRPHQVGPAWAGQLKPDPAELAGILDLDFANLLPSHGRPVLGEAREKFRPGIEAYAAR